MMYIVVECMYVEGDSGGNEEVGRINLVECIVVFVGHMQDGQEAEGRRYLLLFVIAVENVFEGGTSVDLFLDLLFRL